MEKYRNIPTESTLQKTYLASAYNDALRRVRKIVRDNKIQVSTDELTYVDTMYVAGVIVGTFFADHPGDTFLLHFELLDKVNHSIVTILFDNTMKILMER